ncbi:type IV CRISPR-associated protein Csf1 [Verminephrobacter eiseniae]|uniref:type IV CRISPR-associated protein Csf1 n=1 Tax=Verminephrobacter eiseniae TaxID=364317 RepID=UPI0022382662|nr:type IV CRISPR-associated protein Csf1 [Verminephrobacter eiseniae]
MAGLPITSSVIVSKALDLEPDGVAATWHSLCSLCGLEIKPGDLCAPFKVGAGFTDDLSLAARGSGHICGYCSPLLTESGLRRSWRGAFGLDDAKPFRKWVEITNALMNPPKPPFVMVYATASNQHMGWRAPVNYSKDVFRVRVGLRDLLIRRQVVIDAVRACRVLGTAPGMDLTGLTNKETLPHPFARLSSDLKDIDHGRLSGRLRSKQFIEARGDAEVAALNFIKCLSLGETWALRFVLTPNAGKSSTATAE